MIRKEFLDLSSNEYLNKTINSKQLAARLKDVIKALKEI